MQEYEVGAKTRYRRIAQLKDLDSFRSHCRGLGVQLEGDDHVLTRPVSPLAQSLRVGGFTVGNRFCLHPMEGWDGLVDGNPSEHTFRRWRRFGESGAKLIWGGEAVAVQPEGRANPNQLLASPATKRGLQQLFATVVEAHRERYGSTDDLLLGLQLTHSGRFCRPTDKVRLEPRIAYHHPLLDQRLGIGPEYPVLSDAEIRGIIAHFVEAAVLAADAGFQFLDLKHCHGYLGHEFLSAHTREGDFGGCFENRTRFLREIVEGIRAEIPRVLLGVRLSAFDLVPFRSASACEPGVPPGVGIPEDFDSCLPYTYGFGTNQSNPVEYDLTETFQFIQLLNDLGIHFVNVSCGSPYYNPHIQRPALFPPSDGYLPPEDPLVGVARQIEVTRQIKERFPGTIVVGTGYTYLQEFLPNVAQHNVRNGYVDFVGLGRMVLSYHDLPADVLDKGRLDRKRLCRTFSDCTTGPRKGLISGCYPLDPYYKESEQGQVLRTLKTADKKTGGGK